MVLHTCYCKLTTTWSVSYWSKIIAHWKATLFSAAHVWISDVERHQSNTEPMLTQLNFVFTLGWVVWQYFKEPGYTKWRLKKTSGNIRFSALLSPPTLHGNPNSNLDQNVLVEDRQWLYYKSCFVLTWVQAVKNLFENLLRNVFRICEQKTTSKHWSKWHVTISSLRDATISIKNTNLVIMMYWFCVRFLFVYFGQVVTVSIAT